MTREGRQPGIKLQAGVQAKSLRVWLQEIFDDLACIAEVLDKHASTQTYTAALAQWQPAVDDPAYTLSGQMMQHMQEQQEDFVTWATHMSAAHGTLEQATYQYWSASTSRRKSNNQSKHKRLKKKQRRVILSFS